MNYEWGEAKSRANRRKHGIEFEVVADFDWSTAVTQIDDDEHHDELREVAYGFIATTLFVLTFTDRGDRCRVISLRKAERREARYYVQARREIDGG